MRAGLLSKLLLRHGIVYYYYYYYGGAAWTSKHDIWLRQEALTQLSTTATRLAFDSDYEAVLAVKARREQLDSTIEDMAAGGEFTPLVRRLGCLGGISTLTGFALAVEIGDWSRFTGASIGSFVGLTPAEYSCGSSRTWNRSPKPTTATSADCWSRPPGTTAPATGRANHARPLGAGPGRRACPRRPGQTGGCIYASETRGARPETAAGAPPCP
jgi:transposase IS116/IS110/IS902 family protein